MTPVDDIITSLGGATAIGVEIGAPATTVHSWKRSGYVPTWRIPALIALAKRKGKALAVSDFPAERPPSPAEQSKQQELAA